MKMIGTLKIEEDVIKDMTKEEFIAYARQSNTHPKIIERIYDEVTLPTREYITKLHSGYYKVKTELDILRETLDAIILASLEE